LQYRKVLNLAAAPRVAFARVHPRRKCIRPLLSVPLVTIGLLMASDVFMTFA